MHRMIILSTSVLLAWTTLALTPGGLDAQTRVTPAPNTTASEPVSQDTDRLVIYDLGDLLISRDRPRMPSFAEPFNPGTKRTLKVDSRRRDPEQLIATLRRRMDEAGVQRSTYKLTRSQKTSGAASYGRSQELIIVKGAPAAHRALERILDAMRQRREAIYTIDTWIYRIKDPRGTVPASLADEILGEQETVFMLNDGQARTLCEEMATLSKRAKENVTAIAAPRLAIYDAARANISVIDQQSYIADLKQVKVLGKDRAILDPVVKVLQTGIGIDLRLSKLDGPQCELECFYQRAELRRPIETKKTRHGEIQVPVIDITSMEMTCNVKLSGWVLLSTRKQPKLGVDLILLHVTGGPIRPANRAQVIGLGPATGPVDTLFVKALPNDGLDVGTEVRLWRHAINAKDTVVARGVVKRRLDDLAIVALQKPLERGAGWSTGSLLCGWSPAQSKVTAPGAAAWKRITRQKRRER